ncbi:guanylate kinase [Eubacterium oxidoreducens]|uniref:Guanylate kinase n=1 Tax=Eubacterium oxidoreducens TaxID=1732 RepID=A0A1G6AMJ1_EUBOX|nr:guanylate kinase [Eubacterium oxidoreducens]SDB09570.1 guanylate kinase [Eubacterium oxidoreducens]
MNKKGVLIVISGFAGAGKGSIVKGLLEHYPGKYALSTSATTRSPRPGEKHGKEYYFLSVEEFEEMIQKDSLIEYANYVGNYYGTPKEYVMKQLEDGQDVILEIEVQGALNVRKSFPDALLLFVTPPTAQILEQRLTGRGTETAAVVKQRMKRAYEESQMMKKYDYLIVNDSLEDAIKQTHSIIQNEHLKISQNCSFIKEIETQLNDFYKGE